MNGSAKDILRTQMRQLQKNFSEQREKEESAAVWEEIEKDPEFIKAGTILLYMSLPGELPTKEFLDKWYGRKRIAIPKVISPTGMELREYKPESTETGAYGICEPTTDAAKIEAGEIGYAIIPGTAFSSDGTRLGRGKGYYDRLLPQLNCRKVGVCLSYRLIENVPSDSHDIKVDAVFCKKQN